VILVGLGYNYECLRRSFQEMSDDPITVLAVDDEPSLLELLETGLERESPRLTVTTATSASEALATVESGGVDCVLSDYYMPERTGVELLEDVRESFPDLPFVLYTETGSEVAASDAISAGVTDYVIRETLADQHALLSQKVIVHVERRRAERRAATTEARLQELAETSNDALWTFSGDWSELLFINSAHEDLFAQSVEAIRSDPSVFLERIHEDDLDRVKLAMERAAEGASQQIEYRVVHPSGVQLWVESHCHPVEGPKGDVQRITGFTREITERKVHERELAERNEQLDQFTATVAHDLRNPLNVAHGHINAAARECKTDHLETAAQAVERMNGLLEDLLALARAGEGVGEHSTVDVGDLVEAAGNNVTMMRATLDVADAHRIRCDPARLKEAFENLFRNAIEHNDRAVTITTGALPDRNVVYVEDDGDGIDQADRADVFEIGYTTLHRGTGFGLSIVEQIVDAHGWDIEVRSSDPGGARFEITGVEFVD
jgi:PAS domain S-box-containing protein